MPQDLDLPPIYDPLTDKSKDMMSDNWTSYMSSFIDTLRDYLSQRGIFLPQLTTAQRDQIQQPQNGQMIYNTTMDTAQYYKVSSGLWVNF